MTRIHLSRMPDEGALREVGPNADGLLFHSLQTAVTLSGVKWFDVLEAAFMQQTAATRVRKRPLREPIALTMQDLWRALHLVQGRLMGAKITAEEAGAMRIASAKLEAIAQSRRFNGGSEPTPAKQGTPQKRRRLTK
jgi:hypothetical protein